MSDNAHVLHPDALHSDALHSEAPPAVKRSDAVRAITAGAIGHLIEWYDFVVYAYFASTIGSLFFPADNANLSLLLTFAVFGIGFIFRPLGSIVFGHIGDRNGRRNTLVAVIFTMTLSTGLIGLLPTYQQIGVAGPLLLIALRLIQGLAAGGEFGGASSFILEYAPENRRGYFGSYLFGMIGVSLVLGSATGTILNSALTDVQLKAWGWRIPFLISFVLGVVGSLHSHEARRYAGVSRHRPQGGYRQDAVR